MDVSWRRCGPTALASRWTMSLPALNAYPPAAVPLSIDGKHTRSAVRHTDVIAAGRSDRLWRGAAHLSVNDSHLPDRLTIRRRQVKATQSRPRVSRVMRVTGAPFLSQCAAYGSMSPPL